MNSEYEINIQTKGITHFMNFYDLKTKRLTSRFFYLVQLEIKAIKNVNPSNATHENLISDEDWLGLNYSCDHVYTSIKFDFVTILDQTIPKTNTL